MNNTEIACMHTEKRGKMVILNKQDYIDMIQNIFYENAS